MAEDYHLCVTCAWRKDCDKKFKKDKDEAGKGKLRCVEYTRDVCLEDVGPSDNEKAVECAPKKKLWEW